MRDLSQVNTVPTISRFDSVLGTTYEEVALPSWCDRLIIIAEDALYVGCYGHDGTTAEQPTDGGAVGTHRIDIDAGGSFEMTINPPPKLQRAGLLEITSVFIAAQHGADRSACLVLLAGGA